MKKGVCPKKKLSVYVLGIFFWLFGDLKYRRWQFCNINEYFKWIDKNVIDVGTYKSRASKHEKLFILK